MSPHPPTPQSPWAPAFVRFFFVLFVSLFPFFFFFFFSPASGECLSVRGGVSRLALLLSEASTRSWSLPPACLSIYLFTFLMLTTLSHRLVVTVTLQICMRSTHKIVYAQGNPLCPLSWPYQREHSSLVPIKLETSVQLYREGEESRLVRGHIVRGLLESRAYFHRRG